METKTLENYLLDIVNIEEFNDYYHENINKFSEFSSNAFLKALDIPPKFFKEQPEETQEELLDNRDTFVKENKKYFDKVIIVLKSKEGHILNACRMGRIQAYNMFDKLSCVSEVEHIEERTFFRDGYTTLLISENLKKNEENKVLIIDFPVMLNKNVVIHKALYTFPKEDSQVNINHIKYIESSEIILSGDNASYNNIVEAIEDFKGFLSEDIEQKEAKSILRENEVISLALVELKYIPKTYREKVEEYLKDNIKGILNTYMLENFVLDFDQDIKGYKNINNLRTIDGFKVLEYLDDKKTEELQNIANEFEERLEVLA